jgi:hypothetical protein
MMLGMPELGQRQMLMDQVDITRNKSLVCMEARQGSVQHLELEHHLTTKIEGEP